MILKTTIKTSLFSIFLVCLLQSCKSDAERIESANKTVELFVKDLELKNHSSIESTYPDFNKNGRYWVLKDFKINNTKIDGDRIIVYGTYKRGNQFEEPIMFVLNEKEGSYIIAESKGINAYYDSEIYDFLINLGCISDDSNDAEIQEQCSKRESIYESTVEELKNVIEAKVKIDNKNLSSNYGYYVSGNVLITNESDFPIPAASYSLTIGFINTRNETMVDEQFISGLKPPIPPHQTISIPVDYVPINGGNQFGTLFKITNLSPLKNALNQTVLDLNWDCSKVDNISELNY